MRSDRRRRRLQKSHARIPIINAAPTIEPTTAPAITPALLLPPIDSSGAFVALGSVDDPPLLDVLEGTKSLVFPDTPWRDVPSVDPTRKYFCGLVGLSTTR